MGPLPSKSPPFPEIKGPSSTSLVVGPWPPQLGCHLLTDANKVPYMYTKQLKEEPQGLPQHKPPLGEPSPHRGYSCQHPAAAEPLQVTLRTQVLHMWTSSTPVICPCTMPANLPALPTLLLWHAWRWHSMCASTKFRPCSGSFHLTHTAAHSYLLPGLLKLQPYTGPQFTNLSKGRNVLPSIIPLLSP